MTTVETQQNINELAALRVRIRRWRITATLASLVIITTGLLILKVSATNLFNPGPKHDAFVTELQAGLTGEFVPHVKERATDTMNRLVPTVKEEVLRLELRVPEVADAVTAELETLNANLPARAEMILNDTLARMIRERTEALRAAHPQLSNEQVLALVNSLLEESHQRVVKVSDEITTPYLQTFHKITDELNVIRTAEITEFSKDATALDLAMVLIDVVRQEVNEKAPNDPSWTLLSTVLAQAK